MFRLKTWNDGKQMMCYKYTPGFIKNDPYLIAHNFGKCWPIFKFFHPQTQQRSCNELIIKGPSHALKGACEGPFHFVKCKCQETIDNLKEMSRLTINFNLIYYS